MIKSASPDPRRLKHMNIKGVRVKKIHARDFGPFKSLVKKVPTKFMINLFKCTPRGAGDNLIKTSPKLRNSLPYIFQYLESEIIMIISMSHSL